MLPFATSDKGGRYEWLGGHIEERGSTEEQVRAAVEEPDRTGHEDYGRFVADRRFGRGAVRVVYNVGQGEDITISVMRRRRVGGGGSR